MIKAILFDLDGTLLPMDQDVFIGAYLDGMAKKLAPYGYDAKLLAKAVWTGTGAMMKNDGSKTNEAVFWDCFCQFFDRKALDDMPVFEDFYRNEFQLVRHSCGFTPCAARCIRQIRQMGFRTILATNPLFPALATHSRVRWAGLETTDFEYITTYENSRHCKPNPDYFLDILETAGLEPQECVMVGNDVQEDGAARKIGMEVFLLEHSLINKYDLDYGDWPQGSFDDLMRYIGGLNK